MIPFDYGYATHLPMLMEAVLQTSGPVLELGAGLYSTPILHTLCDKKRILVTVEHDPEWRAKFDHLKSDFHIITDTVPDMDWWDVALVDSAPVETRVKYIDQFCYKVGRMIVHDYAVEGHDTPTDYFPKEGVRVYAWLEPKTVVLSKTLNLKSSATN